mgnify:CR=1 FL=1
MIFQIQSGQNSKKIYFIFFFGKYKDSFLIDIPEYYYVWFRRKGFPRGKLGLQMQEIYDLKINGLEHLIRPLKE